MQIFTLILAGFLMVGCTNSGTDKRQLSPHFEDGVFQTTTGLEPHTFWEIAWKGLTSDIERSKWPEWVETSVDPFPVQRVHGNDVRTTFVNHSTFLIQTGGYNIITDPVFSERTSPLSFIGPKRVHRPGIELEKLPRIDVILISHDHYDHLDLATIKYLIGRDNPKIYVGLGVGRRLAESENIVEMDWGDSSSVADYFTLWFLEVNHFSGRTLMDRNTTLWGGYYLKIGGKKIYFGGDSGYGVHYRKNHEQFGAMDIALLPIGAYSPRELFKSVHLNPEEAVVAHEDLHADLSIGMHYGTFQLSAEALNDPVMLLEEAKRKRNIAPETFITLEVGKPVNIETRSEIP